MKKLLYLVLLGALPLAAAAQPITSITQGKDLELRSLGGSISASLGPLSTSIAVPPSQLVQIVKAAGTLNLSFNLNSLFPSLGVNSVVTATGSANTSTNTITWSLSDTSIAGKTITVPYSGTNYTVTIASITGTVAVSPTLVKTPIYDNFDAVYRTETLEPPTTNTATVTISGTTMAYGLTEPVTLTFTPALAGIGGIAPANFVKSATFYNSNVLGGTSFWCKLILNENPTAQTSVTLSYAGVTGTTAPVVFPAGTQTEYVTLSSTAVDYLKPAHVMAMLNGFDCDAAISLLPLLNNLVPRTTPAIGGAPVTVRLSFYVAVPSGGVTVYLHSDDPNVILPTSVVVPANSTYYDIVVNTKTPATATSVTGNTYLDISASYGTQVVRVAIPVH